MDDSAVVLAFVVDLLVVTTDVSSRCRCYSRRGRLQSGRKFLRSYFLSKYANSGDLTTGRGFSC